MSAPSPKKKNGGNTSGPRQIRFVATDGQPQTKRRRVNAACLTCRRRKIRCSGEQPVCKTCSDYKHVCLGYTESTAHLRSQSDSASRMPPVPPFGPNDQTNPHDERAVESCSPEPGSNIRSKPTSKIKPEQSPTSKKSDSKDTSLSRDTSARVHKESTSQADGDSPESNSHSPLRSPKTSDPPTGPSAPTMDSHDNRDTNTIPFYDRDDTLPVSGLVSHLSELFFAHLGCSFPFLQRDRFLQDLKEKKIDTMLVDAVCALAARFSPHPLLGPPQAQPIDRSQPPADIKMWDKGLPFAHRAISALVDSLSCPTLAGVMACLLLAYEQFGSNHDSGLWMYLGISIRMAQDLGLQKHQGLKHNYGRKGVTPSEVMTGQAGTLREDQYDDPDVYSTQTIPPAFGTERARERERVDSFWSIFFLDRVISSGTGRPVTLRDEDIELCFPLQSESQLPNGWPSPFPPLIRVIHLYGRVTDLINGIQDVKHVTPDTLKRLAGMESDLTGIYQRLSPKLHFNAANFQAYVKAKEGTNFILLHFWFHTLIVLLHQPTLLNSFGGSIQHLYPNSRELSMSSAKTIADIISFSELVDGKSFIGNPFTSQPMYIAACAFLMESAYYSSSSSRGTSPPPQPLLSGQSSGFVLPTMESSSGPERKSTAKHILLASAAKENYQRCYKALKGLEAYWEGTGYILTVLDQKAKGIVDPLLYTAGDIENPAGDGQFGATGWGQPQTPADRGQMSDRAGVADVSSDAKWSREIDPSQAIGWALTGATNSSQPNLSLLYQMPTADHQTPSTKSPYSSQYSHSYPTVPTVTTAGGTSTPYSHPVTGGPHGPSLTTNAKYPQIPTRTIGAESPYYLGMNSPYAEPGSRAAASAQSSFNQSLASAQIDSQSSAFSYPVSTTAAADQHGSSAHIHPSLHANHGGMMIESHDVDMNTLHHQESFPFSNGEILPWLEYLPQDVLSFFGDGHNYPLISPDDTAPRPPP
ncbi:hypothetical protein N7478_012351 [Penicillium angulare]|uniref:uncharacterized protein n=1 Tax=Penicillium angulare TaxID=116970 RepID=UPI002540FF6B|nr:uncharacterized protein N7478_012351 [Penicillium angulare]KAJ5259370.1 hypothetical protein N7478_012351 [Penicillium angulare]